MENRQSHRPGDIRSALANRLPLLLFLAFNGLLQFGFYSVQAPDLIRVVKSYPNSTDLLLVLSYTFSLFVGLALGLFALGVVLHRIWGAPKLDRGYDIALIGIESLLAILILVDHKVYTTIGMHLDSDFVVRSMSSPGFFKAVKLGLSTWLSIAGVLAFFVLLQIGLYAASCSIQRVQLFRRRRLVTVVGLILLSTLGLTGWSSVSYGERATEEGSLVTEALPLYQRLMNPGKLQSVLHPSYPKTGTSIPKLTSKKNVLYILVETWRADVISRELTPNLYRLKQQNSLITSLRHYSGGHTTEYGTFSFLYGAHSYHYYPFLQERVPSFPLQVLKKNGYHLAYSASSGVKEWFMGRFMFDIFDRSVEYVDGRADDNDRKVLEFAKKFRVERHKSNKPWFLFLFFTATHHNYIYPPAFEKNRPVLPEQYDHLMGDNKLRKHKQKIVNRYRNSVRYVDHVIGELLKAYADDIRSGKLAVVITGDHGEEFWEHGLMGHGSTRFINERVQVPLLMKLPGVPSRTVPLSSHVDLMPTLLDYLGMKPNLPANSYSNGVSLLSEVPDKRLVVVSGTGFPFSNRRVCLIDGQHKLWLLKSGLALDRYRIMRSTDMQDRKLMLPPETSKRLIDRFGKQIRRFFR